MTAMAMAAAGAMGEFEGTVTVSGESVSDAGLGAAFASITFQNNGQVWATIVSGSYQVDSGTDWIIPNGAAPDDYEVMLSGRSGDAPSGAAENTWLPLSTSRQWYLSAGPGVTLSCSFTISIRKGSGSVLDSAGYSLFAAASS